jgi:hypothetical protein
MTEHSKTVLELFEKQQDVFQRKNKNYGNSYVVAGEVMHQMVGGKPVVLRTPLDHQMYQLTTRKIDKLCRSVQLLFAGEADKVGESVVETLCDDGNYSFMEAGLYKDFIDAQPKSRCKVPLKDAT